MPVAPRRPRDAPSAAKASAETQRDKSPASAGRARQAGPWIAGVLVALLIGSGAGMVWLVQHPAAESGSAGSFGGASIGGPFVLTDGSGKAVTDKDFRGHFLLVYFGYTFCPDVCPTTLNDVAQAMEKLGPRAANVQVLFITVDPKRDTPKVIEQYAAAFSPKFIGLTGTPDQIKTVAREYRVYYAEHRTGPGPNDYAMDHSSILYLMGPDGGFIAPIPADGGPDTVAADVAKYLPARSS
jgi:protein SCO1/2